MPQMSPMWWEILFILFNMTLIMMNIMIYWQKMPNYKSELTIKKKTMNWKW
uniref:ATP synthase F0 subunit 8 n=1 Tax=Nysius inconspicuus TaxID=1689977 RepID=UPI00286BAE9C|nr:ATP synthase F0 subunit 8 [Nysius inconspicuus]WJZ45486.1 ATP synthase F0 subunit 8 [Nysius inconspicuus]